MRSRKMKMAARTTKNKPPASVTGNTTLPGSPFASASPIEFWPHVLKNPSPAPTSKSERAGRLGERRKRANMNNPPARYQDQVKGPIARSEAAPRQGSHAE